MGSPGFSLQLCKKQNQTKKTLSKLFVIGFIVPSFALGTRHRVEEDTAPGLAAHYGAGDSECDLLMISRKALQRRGHLDGVLKDEQESVRGSSSLGRCVWGKGAG